MVELTLLESPTERSGCDFQLVSFATAEVGRRKMANVARKSDAASGGAAEPTIGGTNGIDVKGTHPGIERIAVSTPLNESLVFPPEMCVGDFDGAYKRVIIYKSVDHADRNVGIFESDAGVLITVGYAVNEFIYVLEGHLVTTDADGTLHEFYPGDSFVIPKGWVGRWDMKTRLKKLRVNF
jgi:uncharacterized cupin superfamily protein